MYESSNKHHYIEEETNNNNNNNNNGNSAQVGKENLTACSAVCKNPCTIGTMIQDWSGV